MTPDLFEELQKSFNRLPEQLALRSYDQKPAIFEAITDFIKAVAVIAEELGLAIEDPPVALPNPTQDLMDLKRAASQLPDNYRYSIHNTPFGTTEQYRTKLAENIFQVRSAYKKVAAWYNMSQGERFIWAKVK